MKTIQKRMVMGMLGLLFTRGVAEEVGIRRVSVPLVDNAIQSRDVFQELLKASGSSVKIPEEFPNQKIKVNTAAAPLTVKLWNAVIDDFGLHLSLTDDAVNIRVDLKKMDENLDEFEESFTSFFGITREAELLRLSPPDCDGPVVVLMHGLDSTRRFFKATCELLVEKGYDLYFFEYPNDDKVVKNAERLSAALKTLPESRRKNMTLLTHSMGGVISQVMIETPELYVDGVDRFIACAPPFQGSEMAALRMVVEMGDHAMGIVLDPEHGFSLFGDGMGRAGIDLQPGSLLMDQLDAMERNPKVSYSILAGNKGMVDVPVLKKIKRNLEEDATKNAMTETARRLMLERVNIMLGFQSGKGDGAVSLKSAKLKGVTDRVVLPLHHLQFLSGMDPEEPIGALDEVMKRLPPVED